MIKLFITIVFILIITKSDGLQSDSFSDNSITRSLINSDRYTDTIGSHPINSSNESNSTCIKRYHRFPEKPIRGMLVNHAFDAALASIEYRGENDIFVGADMYLIESIEVSRRFKIPGSIWIIITSINPEYDPNTFVNGDTFIPVTIYNEASKQYLYPLRDQSMNTMNSDGKLQLSIVKFYVFKEFGIPKLDVGRDVGPEFMWNMYKLKNGDLTFCNSYLEQPGKMMCIGLSDENPEPQCYEYGSIKDTNNAQPFMWTFISPYGPFKTTQEDVENTRNLAIDPRVIPRAIGFSETVPHPLYGSPDINSPTQHYRSSGIVKKQSDAHKHHSKKRSKKHSSVLKFIKAFKKKKKSK